MGRKLKKLLLKSCRIPINIIVSGLLITLLAGCTTASAAAVPNATNPASNHPANTSKTQQGMKNPQLTQTPASSSSADSPTSQATASSQHSTNGASIKTVFLIVMENHNWSDILNSVSAPYINQTLLPQASYTQQYFNPPGNHPSEPNYLWLEAGTNYGVTNDNPPSSNHQSSTNHLVTYMDQAGVSWKAYLEGISGKDCPLTGNGQYAPKHNPMVYFDNVTNSNDRNSSYCIAHERPFNELQTDLQNNTVAQYNFITPNLCNDMHNDCQGVNGIKLGDTWLSKQIPLIMASKAYQQGGAIFITWDESEGGDHPIGMIVLSQFAKGGGYSNSIHYTHSSTLRTIQEIFNITPLLGDAANATDLSDLFSKFP